MYLLTQRLTQREQSIIEKLGGQLSHSLETIMRLDKKTRELVEIAGSSINGEGYRALRDIAKGEWVMSAYGILIEHQTEKHSIQQSMRIHIEPFDYGGNLNHSCDGNLIVCSNGKGFTEYYAAKNIKKGEEITYHFALTEFTWSDIASENDISCNCGSSKCEGIIKSFDMLTPTQQREFVEINIVSKYLSNWSKEQQRQNSLYGK